MELPYRGWTLVVFAIYFMFMGCAMARRSVMKLQTGISISTGGEKNSSSGNSNSSSGMFDVMSYGAKGDGTTDDTGAFLSAWKDACKVKSSVLRVPSSYKFLIKPTTFEGNCQGMTFQLDGTMMLPDLDVWRNLGVSTEQWMEFDQQQGLTLTGSGTVEGKGDKWWNLPCKPHRAARLMLDSPEGGDYGDYGGSDSADKSSGGSCRSPAIFKFVENKNVKVQGIQIKNSPQVHLKFDNCDGVEISGIAFSSPATSPNTDGVHLEETKNVKIYNINVANGDDCVSIGAGCRNVDIRNATCKLGHGIRFPCVSSNYWDATFAETDPNRIGSLGVQRSHACVSNISVADSVISDSSNGVRIKTWQGGSGRVSGVQFSDLQMENVRNPLIIDQYYCMNSDNCKNDTSAVHVTDVTYKNIKGTYDTRDPAMQFACSDSMPCTKLSIQDVELKPGDGDAAEPMCWKAHGELQGSVTPKIECLLSGSIANIEQISNNAGC